MTERMSRTRNSVVTTYSSRRSASRALWALPAAALLIGIVGGYGLHWRWTGFQGNDTLWDWLNLVLLPVVVGLFPLWLSTRHHREGLWYFAFVLLTAAFVVVVIGGYTFGWTWTGFAGNTLWDWLKLMLVPFLLPAALTWASRSAARVERAPRTVDADRGRVDTD